MLPGVKLAAPSVGLVGRVVRSIHVMGTVDVFPHNLFLIHSLMFMATMICLNTKKCSESMLRLQVTAEMLRVDAAATVDV